MSKKRKFLRFMGRDEYDRLLAGETLVHPNPNHTGYTNSRGFCFFEIDDCDDDDDDECELWSIRDRYEFASGIVDDYVAVVFESDGDTLFEGCGTYANPYGSFFDTIDVDEYSTLTYSRKTMAPIRSYRHFDDLDDEQLKISKL